MYFPVRPPLLIQKYLSRYVWKKPADGKVVYLTFDDGPVPVFTEYVLQTLKEYNAKATFFCIGNNVERNPELYRRIIEEGHVTGNHTWNHINGWMTPIKDYISDVELAATLINSNLFRPPYGKIRRAQANVVLQKYKIIMWDVLSYDFESDTTSEKCYRNVTRNTRPGSIVVFHDSEKASRNLKPTLPAYLEFLKKEGYAFGTL